MLTGFHSATVCSPAGSPATGTKVLATNVSGKMTMNAMPVTESGERATRPSSVPSQSMAIA